MSPAKPTIPCIAEVTLTDMFKEDLPALDFYANISIFHRDGNVGYLVLGNDFCNGWGEVEQGGVEQCPPRRGAAKMGLSMESATGWVPEVS